MNFPLTKVSGSFSRSDAKPGMAHFAGTGPAGKTCGVCVYRGYYRNKYDAKKHYGCQKFRTLTGRNGPAVDAAYQACRYFEQKEAK